MNQEVELKLELSPQAAEAFAQWPLLPDAGKVAQLHAIYFDTPDRQLQAHGLTLRIRKSRGKRVQTVKAEDGTSGGGLFARAEWEMPVPTDVPVIDTRTPLAALLGGSTEAIQPIFHVDVERRTWLLAQDGATTEIVLDKGAVRSGERQTSICEIELEQKAGGPATLFSLARQIGALIPVRLGVQAKSERGYHLLDAQSAAFKAEAVKLEPDANAATAFRQIAHACIRHYRLNEALLLDHYDPQALHQARVAIRRLRSAFSIFKPMLAQQDVARFQTELRWLADILGNARNLDVLADRAEPDDRIAKAHAAVREEVHQTVESDRVRSLFFDLAEWLTLDGIAEEMPARQFAAERLAHLRRRITKRGRHMTKLDDVARHQVRKSAKKLRYASEFFASLFAERKKQRKRQGQFIDALEALQDDLGYLNDLASTPAILQQHGLSDIGLPREDKKRKTLVQKAAKAHDELADAPRFWR